MDQLAHGSQGAKQEAVSGVSRRAASTTGQSWRTCVSLPDSSIGTCACVCTLRVRLCPRGLMTAPLVTAAVTCASWHSFQEELRTGELFLISQRDREVTQRSTAWWFTPQNAHNAAAGLDENQEPRPHPRFLSE